MQLAWGDDSLIDWISKRIRGNPTFTNSRAVAVIDKEDKVIAGVVYSDYRETTIELNIASESPRWATRSIISQILQYPFEQLNCNRVTAVTDKRNKKAKRFLSRLGFVHEGTLRDASDDCKPLLIFGMTKKEYLRSKWHG